MLALVCNMAEISSTETESFIFSSLMFAWIGILELDQLGKWLVGNQSWSNDRDPNSFM